VITKSKTLESQSGFGDFWKQGKKIQGNLQLIRAIRPSWFLDAVWAQIWWKQLT
jgi:hypothetical protein